MIRLETVNVKRLQSLAKVIGTAITVGGAMVMTLYKGPIINFRRPGGASHHGTSDDSSENHFFIGTLMLIGGCFGWAGFFILQVSKDKL